MSILTKEVIVSQLESTEDFPILLSEVWEWLGFSTKGNAVQSFENAAFTTGFDFEVFMNHQENPSGGRPSKEVKMTIDCFKLWAMSAQTARGKEVRLYYLQVEKEWKSARSDSPQITPDHVKAHSFREFEFNPFKDQNPIAASIFLAWEEIESSSTQKLNPRIVFDTPEFALPSPELQDALSGAFLNLNRSGLAMNKLFHFIDRIPTMQNMGAEQIDSLVESLTEAGQTISILKAESDQLKKHNAAQKTEIQEEGKEIKKLSSENARLNGVVQNLLDRISQMNAERKASKKVEPKQLKQVSGKMYDRLKSAAINPE